MTIYHFLTIGIFITGLIEFFVPLRRSQKEKLFYVWFVVLLLFKGLRWDTGTDWPQYLTCFEESSWSNIFSYTRYGPGSEHMEFGYVFLNVLIKSLTGHYTFFLIITNAFVLYAYYKLLKTLLPGCYLVALSLVFVATELFPVRQTLTTAIFCLSYKYIQKEQFKKYLVCCLVSFTIHRSSLLFVPLYPLLRTKFNYLRSIYIYLGIIVSSIIIVRIFAAFHNLEIMNVLTGNIMDRYDAAGYYELHGHYEEETSARDIQRYLSSFVQLSIFAYPYYKFKFSSEQKHIVYGMLLNAYFVQISLMLIGQIPGFFMVTRVANGLMIFYPLIIGMACFYFIKNNKLYMALAIFIASYYIKASIMPPFNPEHDYYFAYQPYETIIDHDSRSKTGYWPHHQQH